MSPRTPAALDAATLEGRATETVQHILLGEAIDEAPALVFVADDAGGYVAVNKRVCEALGYSRAEILGKRVTDIAVAPEAPELYAEMLESGAANGVTEIRTKDGRLLTFRYLACEVTIARMRFWVSIGTLDDSAFG